MYESIICIFYLDEALYVCRPGIVCAHVCPHRPPPLYTGTGGEILYITRPPNKDFSYFAEHSWLLLLPDYLLSHWTLAAFSTLDSDLGLLWHGSLWTFSTTGSSFWTFSGLPTGLPDAVTSTFVARRDLPRTAQLIIIFVVGPHSS